MALSMQHQGLSLPSGQTRGNEQRPHSLTDLLEQYSPEENPRNMDKPFPLNIVMTCLQCQPVSQDIQMVSCSQ